MTSSQRSIIGSILILVATLSLGFIMNHYTRGMGWMDFTSNKRYTLTEGTKNILGRLTRPLTAKLFFSKTAVDRLRTDQLKQFLRAHAYARDLLKEYGRASNGKVMFEEYDPIKFSAAADEAADLGVQIQPLTQALDFAFGLAITSDTGAKQVIPFIDARDEGMFEYRVTKLIERLSQKSKKKIGVLAGIKVLGDNLSREMEQLYQAQGRQVASKWNFAAWLEFDYDIEQVDPTLKSIPEDIDYLFVIQPKDFKDETLYAIDQYVMRGGKLIAFVDPMCLSDMPPPTPGRQGQYAQFMHPRASDLNRLTSAWGVELQKGKVMVDRDIITVQQGTAFTLLDGKNKAYNTSEVITQELKDSATVVMVHPGALRPVERAGSEFVPLVMSTPAGGTRNFQNTELMQSQQDPGLLWRPGDPTASNESGKVGFEPAGAPVAVVGRLTGKFKSAFPDGLPGAADANGSDEKKDDKPGDAKKPGDKDEKQAPKHLKEAAEANTIVVFSDVDLISNMFIIDPNNLMQRLQGERSKNRALLQNVLDYMAGSNDLISIRSRTSARRPFDYILDIRREAQKKTEQKQDVIQKEIEKYQAELSALQNAATGKNVGLSRAEALKREREANANILRARRELNEEKRKSTQAEEAVMMRAQWLDTLGMPVIVALIGLILWILRMSKRTKQMREDMA